MCSQSKSIPEFKLLPISPTTTTEERARNLFVLVQSHVWNTSADWELPTRFRTFQFSFDYFNLQQNMMYLVTIKFKYSII